MALLKLQDIGKIYVSEGNVAVGIRGVNLEFDKGEFVAVTGASGSGKSTLLNVISGIDTYEEGELFIEGNTTSYFSQTEWEQYRQKYISFIFQDYNILDSFTVLENVELALMHIEDRKIRRARAIELIKRVGLEKYIRQKGSKLSGGQKQRTVIARALAKDSPIILADEPTGNLDSATSKEIVELLREVSADKLLIMVTHNYEQVEGIATRHIRVYDGAIESDQQLTESAIIETEPSFEISSAKAETKRHATFRQGIHLGLTVFKSKPILSAFLCLFMIIGALGIFLVTSICNFSALFEKNYMFKHHEGRVIITPIAEHNFTDTELKSLAEKTGALSYLHYDYLLDQSNQNSGNSSYLIYDASQKIDPDSDLDYHDIDTYSVLYNFGTNFGIPTVGRYPSADNEVLLYLPIGAQEVFGKNNILIPVLNMGAPTYPLPENQISFKVTGIIYYYDNTKEPQMIFTQEGFYKISNTMSASVSGYTQASLFYASDAVAEKKLDELKNMGYIAIMSDETYTPEKYEVIINLFSSLGSVALWVFSVLFLAFFINLCTNRSVQNTKGDMAILRSMGISTKTVYLSVYIRMGLATLISLIFVLIAAFVIYSSPFLNGYFTFIPLVDYLIIALGLTLITWRVTNKQIKKLFNVSVKKNLQGGDMQ